MGSNPTPATKSTAARINARVMVDCVCEACGSKFKAVPHEVKRGKARTCSKHCAAKLATRPDQSGHNNPNWKGGVPKTEKNKRYVERYPEKHEAHRLMTNAIRCGDLVRQPCEVCGEPKVDGHHDDYSKPLDVRWLCRIHHIEAHKGRFGQAGTQALPVDTNREPSPSSDCKSDASPKEGLAATSSNLGAPTIADLAQPEEALDLKSIKVSVRTRESAPFDKKVWQREYMRDHRKGIRRRAAK